MNDRMSALFCLLLFIGCVWAGLAVNSTAEPQGGDAPDRFSAGRAARHLQAVARAPHAVGQPEHAVVRNYIVRQLHDAGVETTVQETISSSTRPGLVRAIKVRNITGLLAGSEGTQAVLLACHYDSLPGTPGAGDDGHAVAALLEVARVLRSGPALRRDVIFLFTDAEEPGLFGARAFIEQHPWKDRIGVVFNFDARGASGPSLMYETSQGNGATVSEAALSGAGLRASSASVEVYRRMRADTDFTRFRDARYPGLNFALIGDSVRYHAEIDNPAHLSMGSLEHVGTTALALTRHFGNLRSMPGPTSDTVYFSLAGVGLVRYPARLAIPLAGVLVLAFLGIFARQMRRGSVSVQAVVLAAVIWIAAAVAWGLVTYLLWRMAEFLVPSYRAPLADVYGSTWLHRAVLLFAAAVAWAALSLLRRRFSTAEVHLGTALIWVILAAASAVAAPSASYLFAWPVAFSLAAAAIGPLAAFSVIPVISFCSFGLEAFRPDMSGAILAVIVLLFGLLAPLHEIAARVWKWQAPAMAFAAACICLVFGIWSSGFSPEQPRPCNLSFGFDGTARQAYWASRDDGTNAYTSPYLVGATARTVPEFFPDVNRNWLVAPANHDPLAVPSLEVIEFRRDGENTAGKIRVRSVRMAPMLFLRLEDGVRLQKLSIGGRTLYESPTNQYDRGWLIAMTDLNADETEVELQATVPPGPLRVHVSDRSYGTPAAPRPQGFMYSPRWPDSTVSAMTYELK